MAKSPRWRGSTLLNPQPTSPEFTDGKDGPTWTFTYEGPYQAALASVPKRLATVSDLPSGYFVDTVRLIKAPGGRGQLVITATQAPIDYTSDTLEVEWTELQKKLETHPRYSAGGAKALTPQDLAQIEKWKEEQDPALRKDFKYDDADGSEVTLSANAQDFAGKLLKGTDSYVLYCPVCRVTTRSTSKPPTAKCGVRANPPGEIAVAGYEYLKTADRRTRAERQWQRVQEWTGAESVDHDLYDT